MGFLFSTIYSGTIFSLFIFWKYSNNITTIEEWNVFGSHRTFEIVRNFNGLSFFSAFNEVHYYVVPESIIDFALALLIDDQVLFWKVKLVYRMLIVLIPIILLLRIFKFSPMIHLILPFYVIGTQSLTKINWDLGSNYSLTLFCVLLILTQVQILKRHFLIYLLCLFLTLPSTINPPSFLAAIFCFFLIYACLSLSKNIRLFNPLIIIYIVISHFILLITFWIVNSTKLSENVAFFSSISAPIPSLNDLFHYLLGFGLWWGDQGFENGTPFYSSWDSLLSPEIIFFRYFLLFMISVILYQLIFKRYAVQHYSTDTLFIIYFSFISIVVFILAVNLFNIWGGLIELSPYFRIFREPDRKFLQIYSLLTLFLIGFALKLSMNFLKVLISWSLVCLCLLLILKIYNFTDKAKEEFYPNPNNQIISLMSEDVNEIGKLTQKGSTLCLLNSGIASFDFLVRNLFISNFGGILYSNFGNSSSLPACDYSQGIHLIISPPNAPAPKFQYDKNITDNCSISRLNYLYILSDCKLIKYELSPLSVKNSFYNSYLGNNVTEYNFEFRIYSYYSGKFNNLLM